MSRLPAALLMSVGLLAAAVLAASQADPRPEEPDAIGRVGEYVRQYLAAARTIVAREKLTLQPLDSNLRPDGSVRRLEYETQVEWEPAAGDSGGGLARVHRELISVDGRARRPGDDAGCLAAESAEPLEFLLPARRSEFTFSPPVPTTIDRRPALRIDYAPAKAGIPSLEWVGDCGHLVMPGQARGRVTVDPATFAVLRLDQTLVSDVVISRPFDFATRTKRFCCPRRSAGSQWSSPRPPAGSR